MMNDIGVAQHHQESCLSTQPGCVTEASITITNERGPCHVHWNEPRTRQGILQCELQTLIQ
eukprot:5438394-Amphidinium_carterae.1